MGQLATAAKERRQQAIIGDYYEQTGSTIRKYYYANGQRVAMRENSTVYYLLTDHLGSTAITADSSGTPCPPCRGAVPPQGGRLISVGF